MTVNRRADVAEDHATPSRMRLLVPNGFAQAGQPEQLTVGPGSTPERPWLRRVPRVEAIVKNG
ncbi:MAG: hypothetical protein ACREP9_23405 [Candidatus Dormibacteraceae bacterium]